MNQNQAKKTIEQLTREILQKKGALELIGMSGSEKACIVANLYHERPMPMVIIMAAHTEAEKFIMDLEFFSGSRPLPLMYFPAYNILPFKSLSYHNETASERIRILYQMLEWQAPPVIVTTVDAVLQKLIPKQQLTTYAELVMEGEELNRDELTAKMIAGGYERATLVEEPGDFSVRGGILDVFSPLYKDPLRIEFFGDMVDSIRFFSAVDQRRTDNLPEAVILPAKEVILEKSSLDAIISRIRMQASTLGISVKRVREIVDRIKAEGGFPGMEGLLPLVYSRLDTFFDYMPDDFAEGKPLIMMDEPAVLEKQAIEVLNLASKAFVNARKEDRLCVEPASMWLKWSEVEALPTLKQVMAFKLLDVSGRGSGENGQKLQRVVAVEHNAAVSSKIRNYHDKDQLLLPLVQWIEEKQERRFSIFIVCSTSSQIERVHSLLKPYGIESQWSRNFSFAEMPAPSGGHPSVALCQGRLSSGFVWPEQQMAVITEDEIFGAKHRRISARKNKVRSELLSFDTLQSGDIVVHEEHGLGRYEGLEKIAIDGIANDFLLIRYKDDDKLYLPVDRMRLIQKYVGIDGFSPVLDKMGGKSWERVREKARKSVEKIAGDLLKLYAARKVRQGYAFSRSDSYFRDFEAAFPYEETTDQLKAIADVLKDMEDKKPMDRLICGDVGYGKTEVALRAAFKAVSDSRQVAVLVPTTVLAEQHYHTFKDRFERYPVRIESLNRFRTPKQQREIVSDLADGKIDIVIGTHRLLQKDVAFKALGLLVIDEEQRFGVKHKEKLKTLRNTVDVLALTATPIPRTLHMSLMGVRDISIIATPPEQRQPIVSYISEFDDAVISEAVRKELKRNGQIFFIHNNINTIWNMAEHLQKLIPEVRLDVAHGRLPEKELETVMLKFINNEIDMLLCTTIVESGLDIPSANTMLVNRADRFGLAQLYQLRGRIGRGDEQAYAYLFIPEDTALGKDARKRLKVLMEYSDLGSGFQIAMSDLQIRGGGAALGASQSGHIAAVGYDMFLKLMERAVSELNGEMTVEPLEPEINISMSAYIPEKYVPAIDQRLSIYRRLARMSELREIADIKAELIDRFGRLPDEAGNILLKIMLRILSIRAGVRRLDLNDRYLTVYFSELHQKRPFGIVDMIASNSGSFTFTPDQVLKVKLAKAGPGGYLSQTKNILKEISRHVNS